MPLRSKRLLYALALTGLLGSAAAAQDSARKAAHPTVAELLAEFRRSPAPRSAYLMGEWVETTIVYAHGPSFSTKGAGLGPDHITVDTNGFRRDNGKFDWVLVMERQQAELTFVSTTQWSQVERSTVTFRPNGDVRFSKDYGGDFGYVYICRMPSSARLVCVLDIPDPGHGVVFRRIK